METPIQFLPTEREREILRLASRGLSNAEIARHYQTSEQVIKNRWQLIYDKLGVRNRTIAVADAIRKGYIG